MPALVTGGQYALIDVTLSLDTSAYGSGDLLADTQEIAGAFLTAGGYALLHSVTVLDEDDQGVAFDLHFLQNSTSLGTENSAPNMSDANARSNIMCRVPIAAADYTDMGGFRVATVGSLNRMLKAASASTSLYVAAVNGSGTPTFTASGLKLRIGLQY
jgi:hypothetical protein